MDYNRLVILDGYDTETGAGHAWVTDGYRETYSYSDDCSQGWGYLHFHMNWGWEGDHNAWYSFDNFNPGDSNFNENNRQLDGIQP